MRARLLDILTHYHRRDLELEFGPTARASYTLGSAHTMLRHRNTQMPTTIILLY